jgi:hypothetical protein
MVELALRPSIKNIPIPDPPHRLRWGITDIAELTDPAATTE